jgi:phospholipid/cholesterol/gamma-HCH transport system substrate-binding protein
MKLFSERNPLIVGAIGAVLTAAAVLTALFYHQLPFVHPTKQYVAHFSEAGGLVPKSAVQVSGFQVGQVTNVSLDGSHVVVRFRVDRSIRLGESTEAAIKTRSLLGAKVLEIIPRGEGSLSAPIPVARTIPPYELTDALADLSTTVEGTDTAQLSQSLATLAEAFSSTPPALQAAVAGLSRFSDTLNRRDAELRSLLVNARKATGVLADRTDQVASLVANSNALLAELRTQSAALDEISGNVSALSRQLSGFVAENRQTLGPAVQKLNGLLTILANRKAELTTAIHRLNQYAMSLGEALSSGPFFNAYVANLLPGQFLQPFIDAAFSDLGLDPNTLPPSELGDPEVGQPATPPLPVPFPRTGQGGEPRLTIPDAITGNPGDRACGPPGAPTSGPGCYPYREPPPAPAPGGPPPGPPAPPVSAGTDPSVIAPTPAPVAVPAPGAPSTGGGGS